MIVWKYWNKIECLVTIIVDSLFQAGERWRGWSSTWLHHAQTTLRLNYFERRKSKIAKTWKPGSKIVVVMTRNSHVKCIDWSIQFAHILKLLPLLFCVAVKDGIQAVVNVYHFKQTVINWSVLN